MRKLTIVTLALMAVTLLWIPGSAGANPIECQRLNHRIGHFEAMMSRAEQSESELWADRFDDHLDELKDRRSNICPGYSAAEQAAAQWRELIKLGAQAALTYFTAGAM